MHPGLPPGVNHKARKSVNNSLVPSPQLFQHILVHLGVKKCCMIQMDAKWSRSPSAGGQLVWTQRLLLSRISNHCSLFESSVNIRDSKTTVVPICLQKFKIWFDYSKQHCISRAERECQVIPCQISEIDRVVIGLQIFPSA